MAIPVDYAERVYAGVLGKIIGVYLGRPFEGWPYERIKERLGYIEYYVHERLGVPLVVPDDDISGAFTFVRALADNDYSPELTAEDIGRAWLNYLIEGRTVLWWGGLGNSTEHTAYLRLKAGLPAPQSGSAAVNGRVVAEQIGAQIFIDGWAMVCPGDPERAADYARRAASVSHDGEAIYGAQVIAAMESQAFVESDIGRLLDTALSLIPRDCVIARLIADIRQWRETYSDWESARERLASQYGYDRYGGNCHMVPNHGLIILSLLYGDDSFQKSLMIVNTSGWDTDCNAANVGCLLGIKNGLGGLDAGPDFRGPVADRLYLPTADGGRAITDAVTEAYHLVNAGRRLAGESFVPPNEGARFHFSLPGSVQSFTIDEKPESRRIGWLSNTEQCLAIHYQQVAPGRVCRVFAPTFLPPEAVSAQDGYALLASPTLFSGQTVRARLRAKEGQSPIEARLYIEYYGGHDTLQPLGGPPQPLASGDSRQFTWKIPDTGGHPVARVGIELSSAARADGTVLLDYLTWDGSPTLCLGRPAAGGTLWQRAWVDGVDSLHWTDEPFRLIQNDGTGLIMQGTAEWQDYEVWADFTPHMADACGLAVRVGGLRRWYGLILAPDASARLVKMQDAEEELASCRWEWEWGHTYRLRLGVRGTKLYGSVDGQLHLSAFDDERPLSGGGVGLVCRRGRTGVGPVSVSPAADEGGVNG